MGSVPLLLGLAMCCTLADYFGRFKGKGKRWEIGHAGRERIEYCMDEDVVEDRRWPGRVGTVQSGKR